MSLSALRGQEVIDVLKESGADTHYLWYETPETRTNYLIVDKERNCTFLGGKGEVLTREITEKLLALMESQMEEGDTLIIAGACLECRRQGCPEKAA